MAMVLKISDDNRETNNAEQQQINHFRHRHPLQPSEFHDDDKSAVCSGCEYDVVGPAYVCTKPTCTFLLHHLCSDLPRRIRHPCHVTHPLILLPSPPYADGEFTCDACRRSGHGFTYHCAACNFDLHVECAALPEIENRSDHQHPLMLMAGLMDGGDLVVCYGCNEPVVKDCWMYCCLACKSGLHLGCAENW